MISITPLFSGSKGNCSLVRSDNTNILLDIGYGYKSTVDALRQLGVSPADISAIVVTHEHSDHIGGLPLWTRHFPTKVYAPRQIVDLVCQRSYCSEVNEATESFIVNDITVQHYVCSHDACGCFGYKFTCDNQSVASVTDTGCVSDLLVDFLSDCDTVQLESNHDVDMLKKGDYPYRLKVRIASDYGHLSNDQAAQVIKRLVGSKVKNVILAHLSENNNTAEMAFSSAVDALSSCGVMEGRDIFVYVAKQVFDINNVICK